MSHSKTNLVRPAWAKGQSWRVEYSLHVPSRVKGPVTSLPPPQRNVWEYRVREINDLAIEIGAVEEGGDDEVRMVFAASDVALRGLFRVEGNERTAFDETVRDAPYFGWTMSQPVIFDWSRFPAPPAPPDESFESAGGERVTQVIEARPDGTVLITMTSADEGEATVSRQVWRRGDPWWSRASIEQMFGEGDSAGRVVRIEGRRLR